MKMRNKLVMIFFCQYESFLHFSLSHVKSWFRHQKMHRRLWGVSIKERKSGRQSGCSRIWLTALVESLINSTTIYWVLTYMRSGASLVAQIVKNLPVMQETRVQPLGWEDPLEKGMATHSSILAWRIPWTEEPDLLQSMGLQRVGHVWVTNAYLPCAGHYGCCCGNSNEWAISMIPALLEPGVLLGIPDNIE